MSFLIMFYTSAIILQFWHIICTFLFASFFFVMMHSHSWSLFEFVFSMHLAKRLKSRLKPNTLHTPDNDRWANEKTDPTKTDF